MPMETGSCPKGGLAGAGAGFFPSLTPSTGEALHLPLGHSQALDSALSRLQTPEMLGRVVFFFFNLFRVKPRRASGEAQPVELDQLNYH